MNRFHNKWIATAASIWIQSSSGGSYAFGIYSPVLKSSQSYSQSTLDTVSVFKDVGANAGVLSGILYSSAVSGRWNSAFGGPWVVLLAGSVQCFAGYFLMWLSVVGVIHRTPVPAMCFFMLLAAHAQTFFNTANVVTAVWNFPDYSGTTVGIMKGFLGLSGAILIQVYETLFKDNPSTFILMLALLPALVSLSFMFLVRIYRTNLGNEKKHLNGFSAVALIIAAYLMLTIIIENIFTLPLWIRIIALIFLILLLLSPLSVSLIAQKEIEISVSNHSEVEGSSKFPETGGSGEYHELPSDSAQEKASCENLNLLQAMRTANFWLLFIAMACAMGSGLATINNISQMGESLGYTTVEINTLVSLWSIWYFLGRFGAGYASDILLRRRGWARPLVMAATLAIMTVGHVMIASGFTGNLYLGSIVVGVCYGSQWSLMPTIAAEIFGVVHMGTIFNTISVASPVGSYLLSVRVIGFFYDREALGKSNTCIGIHCFMLSFLVMASVTLFAFLVVLLLFYRTNQFYQQVVLRRLRHVV